MEFMPEMKMYGADWCPDCQRAKSFLQENDISFEYVNVHLDPEATKRVEQINKGKRIIPTFEILGESYTNPDNLALSQILGINLGERIVFYGADWCPDCLRAKEFLNENNIRFQFVSIDHFDWAGALVEKIKGAFLARYCKKVSIISRSENFSASQVYIDKLSDLQNVETYMNRTPLELLSNEAGRFSSLRVFNTGSGEEEVLEADGVFVFIGLVPKTNFLKGKISLDERGLIATECGSARTNIEGVFAAGDCRAGAIAQVAAATGEGVLASYAVRNYLGE